MFGKIKNMFGGGDSVVIHAPLAGEAVAMSDVNDPTFSSGMLGVGVAIKPAENQVVSPVDGEVAMVFDTGHAVSIVSDDGVEILVHVGLDTVKLKGEHFKKCVATGDSVKWGDLLLEFDRDAIAAAGYDTITPVVVTNADEFKSVDLHAPGPVTGLDAIITVHK